MNTFLSSDGSPTIIPEEVIRATEAEKKLQIVNLEQIIETHKEDSLSHLKNLQEAAMNQENVFEALMEASKCCTLGQITYALFDVGGKYRRSM